MLIIVWTELEQPVNREVILAAFLFCDKFKNYMIVILLGIVISFHMCYNNSCYINKLFYNQSILIVTTWLGGEKWINLKMKIY